MVRWWWWWWWWCWWWWWWWWWWRGWGGWRRRRSNEGRYQCIWSIECALGLISIPRDGILYTVSSPGMAWLKRCRRLNSCKILYIKLIAIDLQRSSYILFQNNMTFLDSRYSSLHTSLACLACLACRISKVAMPGTCFHHRLTPGLLYGCRSHGRTDLFPERSRGHGAPRSHSVSVSWWSKPRIFATGYMGWTLGTASVWSYKKNNCCSDSSLFSSF